MAGLRAGNSRFAQGHDDVGRYGQPLPTSWPALCRPSTSCFPITLARPRPPQHFDHWPASSGPTRLISVLSRSQFGRRRGAAKRQGSRPAALPEMRVPDGTGGGHPACHRPADGQAHLSLARPATRPGITCCRRGRGNSPTSGLPRSAIKVAGMAVPPANPHI